uniref:Uncharacterized protein n=1 Tax=Chlamydomonas euryale TaxID=1486919 RepID=A0A7R9V8X6_9CHLO|mmetsp:Transcript_23290/g.69176  ORF Transcript_23290/g.69176 Transcript_23290/m.69176 type:complete len:160 (+) Transcript_23290:236-715(+)
MVLCILVWDMSMDRSTLYGVAAGLAFALCNLVVRRVARAWTSAARQREWERERREQSIVYEEQQARRAAERGLEPLTYAQQQALLQAQQLQREQQHGFVPPSDPGHAAVDVYDTGSSSSGGNAEVNGGGGGMAGLEPGVWRRDQQGASLREPLLIPPMV